VIPSGIVSKAAAAHFDVFSTVLEAAGATVPKKNGRYDVQGISLLPHLRSKASTPLPDRYLFWDLYGQCGALHGKWKLAGEISNHNGNFTKAVAEAGQKPFELYNLDEDIGEKRNLAKEYPEIYADLKQRHLDWLRQFRHPSDLSRAAATPAEKEDRASRRARKAEKKQKKKQPPP
jgi:arylsulfatase A-like enzyme